MKNSTIQECIAHEDQDPRLSYTEDGRRPLTSTTLTKNPNPNSLFSKQEDRSARDSYDQYGNKVTMHWKKGPWS